MRNTHLLHCEASEGGDQHLIVSLFGDLESSRLGHEVAPSLEACCLVPALLRHHEPETLFEGELLLRRLQVATVESLCNPSAPRNTQLCENV